MYKILATDTVALGSRSLAMIFNISVFTLITMPG
jgi:hypothetical protein